MSEPSPDPYREAPPPPPIVFESTPAERARTRARVGVAFGLLPIVAYGGCRGVLDNRVRGSVPSDDLAWFFAIVWLVSVPLCLVAIGFGIHAWVCANRERKPLPLSAVLSILLGLLSPVATLLHGVSNAHFGHGRRLLRRGAPRLPDVAPSTEDIAIPREAAEGWLKNARIEVASVAAFSHLANELLAIGAPGRLIKGALRAAQEEVDHAELCFAIAGRSYEAGRFPEATWAPDRSPTPASIASECVVAACILERASAIVAERLSSGSELPKAIERVLSRIAIEEASHADHGWEVIEYLRETADAREFDRAMRRTVEGIDTSDEAFAGYYGLEKYGLPSRALWAEAIAIATRETRARLGFDERQSAAIPDQLVGS